MYLNASTSVDDDGIDSLPMVYAWHCADESGSACVSPDRDTLDVSSLAVGAILSIPGGTLPIGENDILVPFKVGDLFGELFQSHEELNVPTRNVTSRKVCSPNPTDVFVMFLPRTQF